MKNKSLFAIMFLFFVLSSAPAWATTYYVDSKTGNDTNPGTSVSTAWKTIYKANQTLNPGDIVYIRAGTYNEFIEPAKSGTAGNVITYSSYNNENVIFTNQTVPNRFHETSAWSSVNGASVEHSTEQAAQGQYSTKFTVNAEGQGIKSQNFYLKAGGNGNVATFWVYSSLASINVYISKGDGSGAAYDKTLSLLPNKWTPIDSGYFSGGASGDNAFIAFKSPSGVSSGIWYVDNVRVSYYKASINLNGKSYIKINGINFEAVSQGFVMQQGSNYNEISHCTFTDTNMESAYSGCLIMSNNTGTGTPSTHNWIHDCTFHDNGYVRPSAGVYWSPRGCPLRFGTDNSDNSSYNLIENNLFYHGGHDLMIISTRYNTIRNNVFHNEGWIKNLYGPSLFLGLLKDPEAGWGDRCILLENAGYNSGYNLIEGNRLGHSGTAPDADGANGIENPTRGNIVRYNYMYGNGMNGYYFKADGQGRPHNNRLYNNTIYKNGGGDDIRPGVWAGISYDDWPKDDLASGNVIINNIVFDNVSVQYKPKDCLPLNIYTNNLETNPLFANPDMSDKHSLTLPDLSLQAGSIAINAGISLTQVTNADSGSGTSLIVKDASYFQDGSWAPEGKMEADWIAVGSVGKIVQISAIDYSINTITLTSSITRNQGDNVWLYKNSSGQIVLSGSAPDIGAYEYIPQAAQNLSLTAGWNWISFNVLPADLSLNTVFSNILDKVEQVKTQTQSAIRSSGAWKGDLSDMAAIGQYKMYKVKVSQACTLNVTGTTISQTSPIQLQTGWNWAAYLPTTVMPIATALASINGQVQEVKSLTKQATYSGGAWTGTLTQLDPGQGYAIKMSGPGTLTYPAEK